MPLSCSRAGLPLVCGWGHVPAPAPQLERVRADAAREWEELRGALESVPRCSRNQRRAARPGRTRRARPRRRPRRAGQSAAGNRGRRNPGRGIAASPRPGHGVGASGGTGHAPRLEIQPGPVPLAPIGSAPWRTSVRRGFDQASLRRRRGEPGGLAWSRRRRTPSCTPGCHRAFGVPRMELAAAESFPAREQLGVLELEILHRHGRYSGHRSRCSGHGEPPSVD